MKSLLVIKLFLSILLVFSGSAFAQSSAKIEQELVSAIKEVQKWSDYGSNYDDAKLSKANEVFEDTLLKYTKNAATLKYPFATLGKLLTIATSDDGKFRVYSWDAETGGTMHDFSRVYQYMSADGKVYSKTDKLSADEDGAGSFVYEIYTVNAAGGNIYIVCTTFIGSNIDHYGAADLYKIEGEELIDRVKLFKTKEGLTDSIGFEYDFFTVADRKDRPLKLILYDKPTKTVKIPIVIADKQSPLGKVTNRFISYKFDGKYFVKVN